MVKVSILSAVFIRYTKVMLWAFCGVVSVVADLGGFVFEWGYISMFFESNWIVRLVQLWALFLLSLSALLWKYQQLEPYFVKTVWEFKCFWKVLIQSLLQVYFESLARNILCWRCNNGSRGDCMGCIFCCNCKSLALIINLSFWMHRGRVLVCFSCWMIT